MTLLIPLASSTVQAQSPFMPGRPLAPWEGPLPQPSSPSQPSSPPQQERPAWSHPQPSTHRLPPSPPPTDRHWEPITKEEDRKTYVVGLFNPALMAVGKTSGRLELAPLSAHALFLEASRLSLFVDEVSRTVTGTEVDVGYHLFPQGLGARGFYLGPRYMYGRGEIPEASWRFQGGGGDIGYQWVIAHHLVINLGAGLARIKGKAEIKEDALGLPDGIEEKDVSSFRALSSQEEWFWVPMVTLGVGFAI